MTPGAIEAAARADRDAQPLMAGDLKRMKRRPQAKVIRRALALTQEEFAVRYHIPSALCATGSKAARSRTGPRKPI
jgi:putative transcriptional regulator